MINLTFEVTPTPNSVINRERNDRNAVAMVMANRAIANIEYNQAGLVSQARRYYNREIQTFAVYEFIRHTTIANYDDLTDGLSNNGYRYFSRRVAIALAELVDQVHRLCVSETTQQLADLTAANATLTETVLYAEERDQQQSSRIEALEEALMGLLTAQGVVEGTPDYQRAIETLG